MNDSIKIHDYGAARLLNPEETPGTLVVGGLTAENTKLEDKDFYQNKAKVREIFSDENGNFKQEEFDAFYKKISDEFLYLNALKDQNFAFNFYEKNNANYRVKVGRKSNPQVYTELTANPTHSSLGLISGNTWSKQTESNRELAQQNQVFDPETNKWTGETLNDLGAVGVLFGDPLVYATWDDEGIHVDPMTGEERYHQKGEWKTDQFGNFYTEKANKKAENLDKQFVKISEVLTDDNSGWNTVDIFDSDNIEASPVKSTIRTALVIGSTFLPWGVGSAIKYGTAALEFIKSLPNVAKMINGFLNDESPEWLNSFDNTMERFKSSQNDATAQKGFWAYENILDLVETSYMQLVQQQAVANLPNVLFKYDDEAEALIRAAQSGNYFAKGPHQYEAFVKTSESFRKAEELLNGANKMSDAISKVYLVTTSMTDSFDTARRSGLSAETSSYVSLFSMLGMYGFLETDYMRGLLTNNKDYELLRDMKLYMSELGKKNIENLKNEGLTAVAENSLDNAAKLSWYKSLGNSIKNFWKTHINSVKSGKFDIKSGMLAEGIEELSEEIMQDTATMLSRGIQSLKSVFTGKEYEDEYSWINTDPLARYSSAFIGGAIGGGIFSTANRYIFQKDAYEHFTKTLGDRSALNRQIVDYVVAGKTSELLKVLEKTKQEFLSDTIAMDGSTTSNASNSQKEAVFDMMRTAIMAMDTFIRNNSLNRSEKDFKNDILIRAGWVKDNSIYDLMHSHYVNSVSELSSLEAKKQSLNTKLDSASDSEKTSIKEEIKKLTDLMNIKKKEIDDLKNGAVEEYIGATMLKANQFILDDLSPSSKQAFAKLEYNMDYDDLPTYAKEKIDEKFKAVDEGGVIDLNVFKAWRKYKELNTDSDIKAGFNLINKHITDTQNSMSPMSPEIILMENLIKALHIKDSILFKFLETDYQENARYNALARLLLGQNVTISSNVFGANFDSELIASESEYLFDQDTLEEDVENFFRELDEKATRAFESTTDEGLSDDEIKEKYSILNTYGSIANYKKVVETVKNAVTGEAPNIENADQIQIIDSVVLDGVTNSVVSKFTPATTEFVRGLIDTYTQAREKFILSDEVTESLKAMRNALGVVESLTLGADEQYINGMRLGANSLVTEALKSKNKNIDLLSISSDAADVLLSNTRELQLEIDFLLEASRKNRGSLISGDKVNSNKRMIQKLTFIQSLLKTFSDGDGSRWGILSENVPELNTPENIDSTDETELKQTNAELRKSIFKFEQWFKAKWDSLNTTSKTDIVKKLFNHYFENNPLKVADVGTMEDSVEVLNDSDFFKYLMLCCADKQSEILENYGTISSESEKCPFDSQEEVVVGSCKMLFTSTDDLNIWMNTVEELLGKDKNNLAIVYKSMCVALGLGGTGKSDVVIPGIIRITKTISPESKMILVVNTETQRKEMVERFNSAAIKPDEIILQPEWKEHVKKAHTNSSSLVHYIVDEFTNMSVSEISEIQTFLLNKNSQSKCILFGDETQVGTSEYVANENGTKADQIDVTMCAGPTIPTQATPVRTFTDVSRRNVLVLQEHLKTDVRGVLIFNTTSQGVDDKFHYHDDGTVLHGIQKDSAENIKNNIDTFIETHVGENKTLLVYTANEIEARELSEKYKDNPRIFVHTKVSEIQGSQWDYVINLWDQSLESIVCPEKVAVQVTNADGTVETKELPVNGREDVIHPVMLGRAINTLFTRARYGTISVPGTTWEWETEQHAYPPIEIGLSKETIESYKTFKSEVFKLAYDFTPSSENSEDESKTSETTLKEAEEKDKKEVEEFKNKTKPTEVSKPVLKQEDVKQAQDGKRNDKTHKVSPRKSTVIPDVESECEFTTAWVPKTEFEKTDGLAAQLGLTTTEYIQFRSLLITSFINGDSTILDALPSANKLRGDWGLIKKSKKSAYTQEDLMPFGNPNVSSWGTEKNFGQDQTWLVYRCQDKNGNEVLLHVAFCHTNQATSEVGAKQTPLNTAVRAIPVEDTFVGIPLGNFRQYHRNTPFDVKTEMSGQKRNITNVGNLENGILVDRSEVFMMSKKQSLDQTRIVALNILAHNDELKTLYEKAFGLMQSLFGISNNSLNVTAEQALQLREFIKRNVDKAIVKKGVIDIENHFCQFIAPFTGKNLDVGEASKIYDLQLQERIKRVNKVIDILNSFGVGSTLLNDRDKQLAIDQIEQLGVVSEKISLLSFQNGEITNDKATVKRILEYPDGSRKSYNSSINSQIIHTLCAIDQVLRTGERLEGTSYYDVYTKLLEFCKDRGVVVENALVNWDALLSDTFKSKSENMSEGFSSLLWANYAHRNNSFIFNNGWMWSEQGWSEFLSDLYADTELMGMLTSLKEINDQLDKKLFLKNLQLEDKESPIKRNHSVRVYKGLLIDNSLDLSTSNSTVFSTSFGKFMSEGKFVQLARLCLYGKPSDLHIPGIQTSIPAITNIAQQAPTPSGSSQPKRVRRTLSSKQTIDGFLKDLIISQGILTEDQDIAGMISFAKTYINENGFNVGNIKDVEKARIIEVLEDNKHRFCAPF